MITFVDDTDYAYTEQKKISGMLLLVIFVSSTYFLCNYILPRIIDQSNLGKVIVRVLGITLVQSFCMWFFQEILYYMEAQQMLNFPLDPAENESLLQLIAGAIPITLMLNLGFAGLKFYFEHTKLKEQHMALEQVHLENKLSALQAQINPHFMFNVLNHIHILIQTDSTLASSVLLQYADILRYQLEKIESESISIQEEVNFMKNYIEVEKLRWQNTLQVKTDWQLSNGQQQLPPLLFIIFIENAFKHVSRSREQAGYIHIQLLQQEKNIVFQIVNARNATTATPTTHACLGLSLMQKRLALLFPNTHTLSIEKDAQQFRVTLTIDINPT
ncbi:sensor histidine kinase [Sphingobacterium sp. Mn56C]|uniref:sensor histidine kinase n=1 Tax=Sphingobacterium sp. Mn56C TaxID=3395261 RepID=UPI003BE7DDBD